MAEESSNYAEGEVERQEVKHGQVGEEERGVHRADQCCIYDREDKVDQVAKL